MIYNRIYLNYKITIDIHIIHISSKFNILMAGNTRASIMRIEVMGSITKFMIKLVNIVGIIMVKHKRQEWIVGNLIQRVLNIG